MGCQRQAGAETRSKAESPEGKSIGIPIVPYEFLLFPLFYNFLHSFSLVFRAIIGYEKVFSENHRF